MNWNWRCHNLPRCSALCPGGKPADALARKSVGVNVSLVTGGRRARCWPVADLPKTSSARNSITTDGGAESTILQQRMNGLDVLYKQRQRQPALQSAGVDTLRMNAVMYVGSCLLDVRGRAQARRR